MDAKRRLPLKNGRLDIENITDNDMKIFGIARNRSQVNNRQDKAIRSQEKNWRKLDTQEEPNTPVSPSRRRPSQVTVTINPKLG